MKNINKLKKEIKKLEKIETTWYCKVCKKNYTKNAYCVENHFRDFHKKIKMSDYWEDDFEEKGNWNNNRLTDEQWSKLIELKTKRQTLQEVCKEIKKMELFDEGFSKYPKILEVHIQNRILKKFQGDKK